MKKIKLLTIFLFTVLISNASVESSYRKMKRDQKTREQMRENGDTLNFGNTLIFCGIIFIGLVWYGYFTNKKNEKEKLEKTKKINIIVNKFCNIFDIDELKYYELKNSNKFPVKHISLDDLILLKSILADFDTINDVDNYKHIEDIIKLYERYFVLLNKYDNNKEKTYNIFTKNYFIGMTKDELLDARNSEPTKKELEKLKTKEKEIWIYGNKSSGDIFTFENNILIKFTDR